MLILDPGLPSPLIICDLGLVFFKKLLIDLGSCCFFKGEGAYFHNTACVFGLVSG